jgi:hypothetical protein
MTQLEKNLLAHKQKIHGNFLTMQNYLMRHWDELAIFYLSGYLVTIYDFIESTKIIKFVMFSFNSREYC